MTRHAPRSDGHPPTHPATRGTYPHLPTHQPRAVPTPTYPPERGVGFHPCLPLTRQWATPRFCDNRIALTWRVSHAAPLHLAAASRRKPTHPSFPRRARRDATSTPDADAQRHGRALRPLASRAAVKRPPASARHGAGDGACGAPGRRRRALHAPAAVRARNQRVRAESHGTCSRAPRRATAASRQHAPASSRARITRSPASPQVAAAAPGAPEAAAMELVFAGERCEDHRRLKHYGVCENWIAQARVCRAHARARPAAAALCACAGGAEATRHDIVRWRLIPRRCRASWSTPRRRA